MHHLMEQEVLSHGAILDIQHIFMQTIANGSAPLPSSSLPTDLPPANDKLDLTSFVQT
ncbi:MAG: hypothetical protein S4CHLAM81_12600 [Chlamydiales bacterium]|nr:hypothetical protein [Chlamydiales bacterium]MCH9636035.1 hypothetical protein [Chlamydiales bacterium]